MVDERFIGISNEEGICKKTREKSVKRLQWMGKRGEKKIGESK